MLKAFVECQRNKSLKRRHEARQCTVPVLPPSKTHWKFFFGMEDFIKVLWTFPKKMDEWKLLHVLSGTLKTNKMDCVEFYTAQTAGFARMQWWMTQFHAGMAQ